MLRKLLLPAAAGLALLCASAPAAAQELRSDRATYFTFSAPVALPTITLPAGRYLFRLADSAATRSVVQVYSEDGSKLHAMLLTMPASRNEVSDEPEVRFLEGAENAPPAIGTWWYPGMKNGWEFIYPREQAMKIAQSSKQPVLTTAQDVSNEEMKNADLVRVTPAGQTPVSGDPAASDTRRHRAARPGRDDTGAAAEHAGHTGTADACTATADARTAATGDAGAAARDAGGTDAGAADDACSGSGRSHDDAVDAAIRSAADRECDATDRAGGCAGALQRAGDEHPAPACLAVWRSLAVRRSTMLVTWLLAGVVTLAQEPRRFASATNLVVLHVTVTDSRGRPVSGLTASAFTVFENDQPQALSVFAGDGVPVTVGLVIDNSISMFAVRELLIAGAVGVRRREPSAETRSSRWRSTNESAPRCPTACRSHRTRPFFAGRSRASSRREARRRCTTRSPLASTTPARAPTSARRWSS